MVVGKNSEAAASDRQSARHRDVKLIELDSAVELRAERLDQATSCHRRRPVNQDLQRNKRCRGKNESSNS
jgi:hypothetical protein